MTRRHVAAILMVMALLSACATGEKITRLDPGMSKEQVIASLGRPDGYQTLGAYEALKYSNRLMSGFSWDRGDYFVILKDGKVTEYGVGSIREKSQNSNVLVLIPLE